MDFPVAVRDFLVSRGSGLRFAYIEQLCSQPPGVVVAEQVALLADEYADVSSTNAVLLGRLAALCVVSYDVAVRRGGEEAVPWQARLREALRAVLQRVAAAWLAQPREGVQVESLRVYLGNCKAHVAEMLNGLLASYVTDLPATAAAFFLLFPVAKGTWPSFAGAKSALLDQLKRRIQLAGKDALELQHPLYLAGMSVIAEGDLGGTDGFDVALLKLLKKSHESYCFVFSAILKSLPRAVSLSTLFHAGVSGSVIRLLKSEQIGVREAGISVAKELMHRLRDRESVEMFVQHLAEALGGRSPGVATVSALNDDQKLAVLFALRAAFLALNKSNKQLNCTFIIAAKCFVAFVEKEGSNWMSMLSSDLLSQFVIKATAADSCVELLSIVHQAAEVLVSSVPNRPLRCAKLLLVSAAVQNDNFVRLVDRTMLMKNVELYIKEASKKVAGLAFELLLCLDILRWCLLSFERVPGENALEKFAFNPASMVDLVLAHDSVISSLADLACSKSRAVAQLYNNAVVEEGLTLNGVGEAILHQNLAKASLRLLSGMSVFHGKATGRSAWQEFRERYVLALYRSLRAVTALGGCAAVMELMSPLVWISQDPSIMLLLLQVVWRELQEYSSAEEENSAKFERVVEKAVAEPNGRYSRADWRLFAQVLINMYNQTLRTLVDTDIESEANARSAALLMLILSHPVVSPSYESISVLRRLIDVPLSPARSDWYYQRQATAIVELLVEAAFTTHGMNRQAAHHACRLLFDNPIFPNEKDDIFRCEALRLTKEKIANNFGLEPLFGLSREDVELYLGKAVQPPEPVPSSAPLASPIKTSKAVESQSKGNSKAKSSAKAQEDWAEKVRKEAEAKKAAEADVQVVLAAADSSSSAARREEVKLIVLRVRCALELSSAFAHLKDRKCAEDLFVTMLTVDGIWEVLAHELTTDLALQCLTKVLRRLTDSSLWDLISDLVAAVRLASIHRICRDATKRRAASDAMGRYYQEHDYMDSWSDLPGPLSRMTSAWDSFVHAETVTEPWISMVHVVAVELGYIGLRKKDREAVQKAYDVLSQIWGGDGIYQTLQQTAESRTNSCFRLGLLELMELCLQFIASCSYLSADNLLVDVVTSYSPLSRREQGLLLGSNGVFSSSTSVRSVCVELLSFFQPFADQLGEDLSLEATAKLLVMSYQDDNEIKTNAERELQSLSVHQAVYSTLMQFFDHHLMQSVAKAMCSAFIHLQDAASLQETWSKIMLHFEQHRPPTPSKATKAAGKEVKKKSSPVAPDLGQRQRLAVACIFKEMATMKCCSTINDVHCRLILDTIVFVLEYGVIDSNTEVANEMTSALQQLVTTYGQQLSTDLLQCFEGILARQPGADEDLSAYDSRHAAAIVSLGTLCQHLDKESAVFLKILRLVVDSLKIPSESVQRAVSNCLVPLAQATKGSELMTRICEELIQGVLNGKSYGDKRGSAFGLSAVVKGLGILSLKQFDIINRMKDACAGGSISSRQGALMAFECLADRLGVLFEPYLVGIIDLLLVSFSHNSDHVREAAHAAAKVIMAKLSAHGVKQILVPITSSLAGSVPWKTRQEALKILGTMANCAPKQLATFLPQIVPCLVEASNDSHPKVKEAAKNAMTEISSVIRNPEIAQLSGTLLSALGDPANKTKDALDAMLRCEFMHTIDAPSLALIVPILVRALKDRAADAKRRAAAITGNILTMTADASAVSPYLQQLLGGVQDCLMDPVPDVRASGAKALGLLYSNVQSGPDAFSEVMRWLFATLQSKASPVERSGAGQGLAEICGSTTQIAGRSEQIIEKVLALEHSEDAMAREGLLWFLSFLPYSMKSHFTTHITTILPIIIERLSDSSDAVREVAIRAGKVTVTVMGLSNSRDLAPVLLQGLFREDYKIRVSALQLLGDLLQLVAENRSQQAAATAGGEEDPSQHAEEDMEATHKVLVRLRKRMGAKLVDEILASVYMMRCDVSIAVRQHALQIWKTVVINTPRVLMEVMPVLVITVVHHLSSDGEEMRMVAASTIGELVTKLGERALKPIILPLTDRLHDRDVNTRLGVCFGLSEILRCATKKQAEEYIDLIIDAIKNALLDQDQQVCEQAAKVFMVLFKGVGQCAVESIVPVLLRTWAMGGDDAAAALRGLRQIVSERPRDMLEYLIPKFLTRPISSATAAALAVVVEVAGAQLTEFVPVMMTTICAELAQTQTKLQKLTEQKLQQQEVEQTRLQSLQQAGIAVVSHLLTSSIHIFVTEMSRLLDDQEPLASRRWGYWLLERFFAHCQVQYTEYLPVLLKFIFSKVAESERVILEAVRDCATALVQAVPVSDLITHLEFMRSCMSSAVSAARHRRGSELASMKQGEIILPLFCLPKSVDPLFSICLSALTSTSSTITAKESAAELLAETASMANIDILKPQVTKAAGPLIRVVGERYPSSVKSSILQALIVLMDRGHAALKIFVPQLQTTCVKALVDPSKEVRERSRKALIILLLRLSPRLESLLTELCNLCAQQSTPALRVSHYETLSAVLCIAGDKSSVSIQQRIAGILLQNVGGEEEDSSRLSCVRCLEMVAAHAASEEQTLSLLQEVKHGRMEAAELEDSAQARSARLLALAAACHGAGGRAEPFRSELYASIAAAARDELVSPKVAAAQAIAILWSAPRFTETVELRRQEYRSCAQAAVHALMPSLLELLQSKAAADIRTEAMSAVLQGTRHVFGAVAQHLEALFRCVLPVMKEVDLRVKYIGEGVLRALLQGGGKEQGKALVAQFIAQCKDAELMRGVKDLQRLFAAQSSSGAEDPEQELQAAGGEDVAVKAKIYHRSSLEIFTAR